MQDIGTEMYRKIINKVNLVVEKSGHMKGGGGLRTCGEDKTTRNRSRGIQNKG